MRPVIIGCLLLAGFARTEGAEEVRHLDVVVRDGRSRIVSNLETPDFSITENGRGAAVRTVKMADPKQTHLLSLLFDNLSGEPARLARDAAFELVNAASKSIEMSAEASFRGSRVTVMALIPGRGRRCNAYAR